MNIIFNDSNTNVGGIEVLFLEMTKYFINNGHSVFYLVRNSNSIYERKLYNNDKVSFIRKKQIKPVELFSNGELRLEKKFILSQLSQDEDFIVISPYYQALQYSMAVFGDNHKFKLMHLWSHPQSWANSIGLKQNYSFIKKKTKNKKYYYQRELIMQLNRLNADYYAARSVPVFNSWFYEIDLNPMIIKTVPIEDIEESFKKDYLKETQNSISVIWCGRFAHFKNEAIIHINNTLEELAKIYPEKTFSYGIIGFGSKNDTEYIKSNIKSQNVNVKFYGKVDPSKLTELFSSYDIGIGMGLTVKKMGQVGLPAIVIDSFESGIHHVKNTNWIFDTKEGDAGDGYYFKIAGKEISNREKLVDLLDEVINEPEKLAIYSNKALQYVEENYSFDKQVSKIFKAGEESKFYGKSFPIYRRSFIVRNILSIVYYSYRKIRLMND